MSKGRTKAPSQRQLRVGEELRHALASLLERDEVHDPAVQGVTITITEVRVSPDLKNATAYVIPLGGDADRVAEVIEGLSRAAPYLRRRLAEKVQLRHAPKIGFAADTTFDTAGHIDSLLRDPAVARDLAAAETDDGS
ncbi:MAG: 30S ribosome-binding factor RbfA [Magnetovibrio sp.]|nr:30S ribosome-binding factor RbfA [Magnetovibrio sp.]